MYFETSRDILNMTLSVSVVILTIFICWGIYYGIKIIKGISDIIEQIQRTAQRVEQLVVDTKEKIERAFSAMNVTSNAVKGVMEYFAEKKREKNSAGQTESSSDQSA